jgi:beta-lactamase superfamily II metal-dependent hydrolase
VKVTGIKLTLFLALFTTPAAAQNLDVYTIDVEGGKSVLVVSPSGESMLVDAGWPESNARPASTDRIIEAATAAGLSQIDYLVISHFDTDHIGDVPRLAAKFPVRHILDHGEIETPKDPRFQARAEAARQRSNAYAAVRDTIGYTRLKPGDKVPIKGIDVLVVSAGGKLIGKPVGGAGAPNPLCASNQQADPIERDVEDNQSVGLLYTFGNFRMLDLADLEAHYNHELVCPDNLIGPVDIYHVNVHGQFKGIAPEMVGALRARVMIQGNGARKGADAETWPVLREAPGLEDIWQVHYSLNAGRNANPPDDFVANLEPADGFKWIKVSVDPDGTFTVSNSRNGFSKTYRKAH